MKILENSESNNTQTNKSKNIVVKKSTFNKLIMGIVITSIVSAFLGGYFIGINSVEPEQIFIRNVEDVLGTTENKQATKPQTVLVSLDDDPVLGNPNAPITIVEFSDFQCPFCAKFHTQTLPLINENYIKSGKVNFVYRDFPIQSSHPNAMPAALASECADDQEKFWEYHNMIFENQNMWNNLNTPDAINTFKEYATKLGLDSTEFDSCLSSAKYLQEVNKDLQEGQSYGVTGTPGFFVGNEKIGFTKVIGAQSFSAFQKILDEQLSR